MQATSATATPHCTLCCSNGRTKDIPRTKTPRALEQLLGVGDCEQQSKAQQHVLNNIRRYNAAMGFVSFGDAGETAGA